MKTYLPLAILLGLLCIAIPVSAEPTTWYVDDDGEADFSSILDAVNNASSGDTIIVLPGSYSWFRVTKPYLTIQASTDDGSVIVDCINSGGLEIPSGSNENATGTILDGLTIVNPGAGVRLGEYGPASDSVIRNCTFLDLSAGEGLQIKASNVTFADNIISNATCQYSALTLTGNDCLVSKNIITSSAGAAISCSGAGSTGNLITNNTLSNNRYGIEFYKSGGDNAVYQNNFVGSINGDVLYTSPINVQVWNTTAPVTYTYKDTEHTGFVGNFWSNYTASDVDGDGILDTPHVLPDGLGTDHAPLAGAWEGGVIVAGPAPATPSDVTITFPAPGSTYEIGIPVRFSATATGADLTYTWETGDGGNATGQDVNYTYSKPGTYTVNLTVSNEHGSASAETGIVVTKPDPIIFNTSVTVYADEPIVVDNTTYGGNTFFNILAAAGYTYTYGDSESGYSDRKPLLTLTIDDVTYPTRAFGADYKWKFYETIGTGDDKKFKKSLNGYIDKSGIYYIWYGDMSQFGDWDLPSVNNSIYVVELTVDLQPTRPGIPVAGFTTDVTSGDAPLAVAFTDTSTGASSWSWTFGDGATSAEQNPVHTYTTAGTYTVTLTVTNTAGSASTTQTITVTGSGGEEASVLTLHRGWNFVSTPKRLAAGANTFAIFNGVDTAGRTILLYDGLDYDWKTMGPNDAFRPLDGVWIYANTSYTIPLTFAAGAPELPPAKDLGKGWNAIGFTGTAPEAAAPTLLSLGDRWATLIGYDAKEQKYEDAIIRSPDSTTQKMQPMQGYWIYMTQAETLAAISA
ncbi:MAG: PKD domain-containing protein [Methanoculleus sp.]|nr:PKD domain-containing protein [Methanoculleus sp.]